MGSSRRDLSAFPLAVKRRFGFALHLAQLGLTPPDAKPLHGFDGGVLELVEASGGDAWRAVYVIRFSTAIYVLHAFQKKSTRGSRTSRRDIELIRRRLRMAREEHEADKP